MVYKKTAGLACLIVGGLVWPVGLALEFEIPEILPVHLTFIGGGLVLRGSHLVEILRRHKR